jgi:hypothetical protein
MRGATLPWPTAVALVSVACALAPNAVALPPAAVAVASGPQAKLDTPAAVAPPLSCGASAGNGATMHTNCAWAGSGANVVPSAKTLPAPSSLRRTVCTNPTPTSNDRAKRGRTGPGKRRRGLTGAPDCKKPWLLRPSDRRAASTLTVGRTPGQRGERRAQHRKGRYVVIAGLDVPERPGGALGSALPAQA